VADWKKVSNESRLTIHRFPEVLMLDDLPCFAFAFAFRRRAKAEPALHSPSEA